VWYEEVWYEEVWYEEVESEFDGTRHGCWEIATSQVCEPQTAS